MKSFKKFFLAEEQLTNVPVSNFFKQKPIYAIFAEPPKKYLTKMKVDIKDIAPAQDDVHQEYVDKYAANPPKDLPIIIKMEGRFIAFNHTRIAGQVQAGNKMISVRAVGYNKKTVMDMTNRKFKSWYKI